MVSVEFLIFLSIFEVIGYVFHGSILLLLFFKRKTFYRGSFYTIFWVVIIADLVSFLLIVVGYRIPLIFTNFLKDYGYLASLQLLLTGYFLVIQFCGHMFMAFNRFTLFWFRLKHDRIWRKNWYTIALFVIPLIHIFYRINEPGIFIFAPDNTVIISYTNKDMQALMFIASAAIFVITTFIAAIFNILSLIKFYFYKKATNHPNIKEKRLFVLNCVMFIAQFLRLCYSISRSLFETNEAITALLIAALPFISDIFAWAGSISLLLLSPRTRKEYLIFYLCKRPTQIKFTSFYPAITNKNV